MDVFCCYLHYFDDYLLFIMLLGERNVIQDYDVEEMSKLHNCTEMSIRISLRNKKWTQNVCTYCIHVRAVVYILHIHI